MREKYRLTVYVTDSTDKEFQYGKIAEDIQSAKDELWSALRENCIRQNCAIGEVYVYLEITLGGEYFDGDERFVNFDGAKIVSID